MFGRKAENSNGMTHVKIYEYFHRVDEEKRDVKIWMTGSNESDQIVKSGI